MRLIAHRGNFEGQSFGENTKLKILAAAAKGCDVEVDLWLVAGSFCLGHDAPTDRIPEDFLERYKNILWCHAKNKEAFIELNKQGFNAFSHNKDPFALTTKGYIWEFPLVYQLDGSVYAICADDLRPYHGLKRTGSNTT